MLRVEVELNNLPMLDIAEVAEPTLRTRSSLLVVRCALEVCTLPVVFTCENCLYQIGSVFVNTQRAIRAHATHPFLCLLYIV